MDELREKYIQGKLSEAERNAFEEGLSPEEKEALATELGIQSGLEHGFREELRAKVAGFEEKENTARRMNPAYISIAASLFVVASLVLYFTRDQASLFDQYYKVYPNYELTTVRGEEDVSDREKAYRSYDMGDYAGAIAAFSELETLKGADYFFRAICFIQLKSYEEALADLSSESLKNDKAYADATKWYTALVHIKMQDDEKAIPLLKELVATDSEYAVNSNELLGML